MKGDITRSTFRPEKHYSGVRMQQGRVQLDADLNEQVDIQTHRRQTLTKDVIGLCGVPRSGGGFRVAPTAQLTAVSFIDSTTGWTVGEDAAILATIDGGATWTAQSPPAGVTANLNGVYFVNSTTGWAVGESGTILATTNGGTNWVVRTPTGVTSALRRVFFLDATTGWAVGNDATILATIDGGTTWTAQTPPAEVTSALNSVLFTDANTGWAVGNGATISATADGGATWTAQTPPAGLTANLADVSFVDSNTGWAVGTGGTILTTTDGGATWTSQSPPAGVTAHLTGVSFFSSTAGWAVGHDATILATTDGGTNWTAQSPPAEVTSDLKGVSFTSSTNGWAVGDGATVLATTDGGQTTWVVQTLSSALPSLGISAGRIYVDGILCENESLVSITAQPDLPADTLADVVWPGPDGQPDPGTYLAYLDVWQRHVTAIEDPDIREVALGGADTTTRTKTLCQVKLFRVGGLGIAVDCSSQFSAWDAHVAASSGKLSARAQPPDDSSMDPCIVLPDADFRGLENQLYRVEIQTGGSLGNGATFKWSRENGSIVTQWLDQNGNDLSVSGLNNQNQALGFASGQWVELTDDTRELRGERGTLVRLTKAEDQVLTIDPNTATPAPPPPPTATGSTDRSDYPNNPKIRRWDMPGQTTGEITVDDPGTNDGFIALESGIEVKFEAGTYTAGDYWFFPARTATGGIEWPLDEETQSPLPQRPDGVHHHFCRLGLVQLSNQRRWSLLDDCRCIFDPLTALPQLFYVSGDGQQARPGQLVCGPLVVRLASGCGLAANATVRFKIVEPAGGGTNGKLLLLPVFEDRFDDGTPAEIVGSPWLHQPGPVENKSLLFETDFLDLGTGTVLLGESPGERPQTDWDIQVAFNADRRVHSVIFQNQSPPSRQIAHLENSSFEAVSQTDVASASFTANLIDVSFDPSRVILIRNDRGAVFKLGNPVEDDENLTFDYQQLIPLPQFVYSSDGRAETIGAGVSLMTVAGVTREDVVVEAQVDATLAGADAAVVARYGGPGDQNMYLGRLLGQNLEIHVNIDGTLSQLGTTMQVPVNSGTLRFEVVDESLTLTLITDTGTFSVRATDTTLQTGGVGLRGNNVTFDDFRSALRVGDQLDVTSDTNGLASCRWQLDDSVPPNVCQQVTATLVDTELDLANQPLEAPIVFNAKLSIASEVAYAPPDDCERFEGLQTVQQVLDTLCEGRPVRIVRVYRASDPTGNLRNDSTVAVDQLMEGIRLDCTDPVDMNSIKRATCHVTVELPQSSGGEGPTVTGYAPAVLLADLSVPGQTIEWTPRSSTLTWLNDQLTQAQNSLGEQQVLARLIVKGNFVWASGAPDRFLDGDTFGVPAPASSPPDLTPENKLPTHLDLDDGRGDTRRGGDFRLWFWIEPTPPPPPSRTTFPLNLMFAPFAQAVPQLWVSYSDGVPSVEEMIRYDVFSGTELGRIPGRLRGMTFGGRPRSNLFDVISFDIFDDIVYAMDSDGIRRYDPQGDVVVPVVPIFTNTFAMAFHPRAGGASLIYVADFDNSVMIVYDEFSGGKVGLSFPTPPVTGMAFDRSGEELWIASRDAIRILDPFSGAVLATAVSVAPPSQLWGLAIGDDDNVYVTSSNAESDTHEILRFDRESRAPNPAPGQSGAIFVPNARNGGLNDPRDLVYVRDDRFNIPPTLYVASYAATGGIQGVLEYDGDTGVFRRVFIKPPAANLAS